MEDDNSVLALDHIAPGQMAATVDSLIGGHDALFHTPGQPAPRPAVGTTGVDIGHSSFLQLATDFQQQISGDQQTSSSSEFTADLISQRSRMPVDPRPQTAPYLLQKNRGPLGQQKQEEQDPNLPFLDGLQKIEADRLTVLAQERPESPRIHESFTGVVFARDMASLPSADILFGGGGLSDLFLPQASAQYTYARPESHKSTANATFSGVGSTEMDVVPQSERDMHSSTSIPPGEDNQSLLPVCILKYD